MAPICSSALSILAQDEMKGAANILLKNSLNEDSPEGGNTFSPRKAYYRPPEAKNYR